MVVVTAIRFEEEEKKAIERVVSMIKYLEDGEFDCLNYHLEEKGIRCDLDDIKDGLRELLALEKGN